MKNEIGGYFELEEMAGEEYYPDLYKVNLGRTALLWLLETRQYKKIYLPVFLCQSVIDICREHNIEVKFYHLDIWSAIMDSLPMKRSCIARKSMAM